MKTETTLLPKRVYERVKSLFIIDVFWWSRVRYEKTEFENFGDCLVPFLLEKFTSSKFRWVSPNMHKIFRVFKRKHYFIIGSILNRVTAHSVVWGAGIIKSNEKVQHAEFLSVRGPRTRKRLLDLGYEVPENYGDPAILLALLPKPKLEKKFKLGIMPHYIDFEEATRLYKDIAFVKIIDLSTNHPQEILDSILECEYILSSSLHGIIASQAFGVPALWLRLSDNLTGDDVKFKDYYESLDMFDIFELKYEQYDQAEIEALFSRYKAQSLPRKERFDEVLRSLVDTFPFKKSKEFKKLISAYFENLV